jgi:hypothetical protein
LQIQNKNLIDVIEAPFDKRFRQWQRYCTVRGLTLFFRTAAVQVQNLKSNATPWIASPALLQKYPCTLCLATLIYQLQGLFCKGAGAAFQDL